MSGKEQESDQDQDKWDKYLGLQHNEDGGSNLTRKDADQ